MLRTAFKNYFRNYKYILLSAAIIFVGLAVFALIFYFAVLDRLRNTAPEVFYNLSAYFSELAESITISDIFKSNFLQNILTGIYSLIKMLNPYLFRAIIWTLIGSLIFVFITVKIAQILCKSAIRNTLKTRYSVKKFWQFIIRTTASILVWALFLFLTYIWFFSVFLLPFVDALLRTLLNLFSTWLIHFKKIKITKLINLKNVFFLFAANLVFLYLHFILFGLILGLTNIYVVIIIALPLLAYNYAITDVTATSFFIEKMKSGELKKQ